MQRLEPQNCFPKNSKSIIANIKNKLQGFPSSEAFNPPMVKPFRLTYLAGGGGGGCHRPPS